MTIALAPGYPNFDDPNWGNKQLTWWVAQLELIDAAIGGGGGGGGGDMFKADNLAGLDKPLARANLDLGNAATADFGVDAGTIAAGDDPRIVGALQTLNALAELVGTADVARANLDVYSTGEVDSIAKLGVAYILVGSDAPVGLQALANAVGDGTGAGDAAALNAAFALLGTRPVWLYGSFHPNAALDISAIDGVAIFGDCTIYSSDQAYPTPFLHIHGSRTQITLTTPQTGPLAQGKNVLTAATVAAGLTAGDWVALTTTQGWGSRPGENFYGETLQVESVTGTTVTFKTPFRQTYLLGAAGFTLSLYRYDYIENLQIEGVRVVGPGGVGHPTGTGTQRERLFVVSYANKPRVRRCYVEAPYAREGLALYECRLPDVELESVDVNDLNGTSGTYEGYGLRFQGCEGGRGKVVGRGSRHLAEVNGGQQSYGLPGSQSRPISYDIELDVDAVKSWAAAAGDHPGAVGTYFKRVVADGCSGAIFIRGKNARVNAWDVRMYGGTHEQGPYAANQGNDHCITVGEVQRLANGTTDAAHAPEGWCGTGLVIVGGLTHDISGNASPLTSLSHTIHAVHPLVNATIDLRGGSVFPTGNMVNAVGDYNKDVTVHGVADFTAAQSTAGRSLYMVPAATTPPKTTGQQNTAISVDVTAINPRHTPVVIAGSADAANPSDRINIVQATVRGLGSGLAGSDPAVSFGANPNAGTGQFGTVRIGDLELLDFAKATAVDQASATIGSARNEGLHRFSDGTLTFSLAADANGDFTLATPTFVSPGMRGGIIRQIGGMKQNVSQHVTTTSAVSDWTVGNGFWSRVDQSIDNTAAFIGAVGFSESMSLGAFDSNSVAGVVTTSGAAGITSTAAFLAGMSGKVVVGTGIPLGTTATYVDASHMTLSANATASGTITMRVTTPGSTFPSAQIQVEGVKSFKQSAGFASLVGLQYLPLVKNDPTVAANIAGVQGLLIVPVYQADGRTITFAGQATLGDDNEVGLNPVHLGVQDWPFFNTVNGGVLTKANQVSFGSLATYAAGAAGDLRRGFEFRDAETALNVPGGFGTGQTGILNGTTGTYGTLDTQYGVLIRHLQGATTANIGIWNASTTVEAPLAQAVSAGTTIKSDATLVYLTPTGSVTLTSNPQVVPGMKDGQRVRYVNQSLTSLSITFVNGNGVAFMQGSRFTLRAGATVDFVWFANLSLWACVSTYPASQFDTGAMNAAGQLKVSDSGSNSLIYGAYNAYGDANPAFAAGLLLGTGFVGWGPGGASALDAFLTHTGAAAVTATGTFSFPSPILTSTPTVPGGLFGNTTSAANLVLNSTSHATKGYINLVDEVRIRATDQTFSAAMPAWLGLLNTYTLDITGTNAIGPFVNLVPTVLFKQSGSGFGAAIPISVAPTYKNVTAGAGGSATGFGSLFGIASGATITADTTTGLTGSLVEFSSSPTTGVVNAGTMTLSSIVNYKANAVIGAGTTVTALTEILLSNPTGAGTLTTLVGIDIPSFTKGGTNIGIRNKSSYLGGTTGQLTMDGSGNISTSGTLGAGATTVTDFTATGNVAIGDAITDTIGLYGVTKVAQRASANQAAVGTTAPAGGTGVAAGGWSTSGNRDTAITTINSLVTLVNELRTALVNIGLIKGSA